ncbi:flavodoxin [Rhodococcus ruber Chol-4]|uniref:flavodoxin domain-containing protein n=1 Tax=Rhodococcus TaxID=1827 RepID=UPI00034DCAE1|nr:MULTISPECIES: flavodoxin domain-containing protein [Rhodococcus]MDX5309878.1 flavodoxin domain-containing protein [Rhodococcus sp. (in: high G+C Gram-positive bacteria)]KXF88184.1 flavodoxin [Rhodococcus ruber Chol-4]MDV3209451.1 flavodoxin domain-containing protein [Rhodococcus ruber]MDX5451384.1 flavodoxin domain-containing protein [Rhodococcus sp. (in: high G+C Gram-positive bacteria)]UIR37582.1 flavodoxin domain-containing protein [Rhodococcus sp. DMF-1]
MKVLVAYASRHGATAGIAERIAEVIRAEGHTADTVQLPAATSVDDYDACVVGSSAYLGHWEKAASAFVREHRDGLVARPVWLFTSGPLGTEEVDEQGQDVRESAAPRELPELTDAIAPREHHVFFGALDPKTLGVGARVMRKLPAGRKLLPEGDFRDWQEIEDWARSIVRALA